MNGFKRILLGPVSAIGRPVWRELPFFLAACYLLAPASWYEIYTLILKGVFELGDYYTERAFTFVSVGVAVAIVLTVAVHAVGRRGFKAALYVLLLANLLMGRFIYYNFNAVFSPSLAIILGETTPGESREFLGAYLATSASVHAYAIVVLVAGIAVMLEELWRVRRTSSLWGGAAGGLVVLALLVCGVVNMQYTVAMLRCSNMNELEKCDYFYIGNWDVDEASNYAYTLHTLRLTSHEIGEIVDNTCRAAQRREAAMKAPADSALTLVVVIGESYNKHHASLYGYDLPTTPNMDREQRLGNLVAFTDVIAPYNTTSVTLKNVFSCNSMNQGQQWYDYPMFPALFKTAGYKVMLWDNQIGTFQTAVFSFSLNSVLFDRRVIKASYDGLNSRNYNYDGDLVDDYFRHEDARAPRQLVLLHLMGQHLQYADRYPHGKGYDRWTAAHIKREAPYLNQARKTVIANYANATLYNDAVLERIFAHYRKRNAVVMYFSDHGEEVYDYRNYFGRDHNISRSAQLVRNDNEIPLVLWFSPVYKARHPEVVARAQAACHRPMVNDDVSNMLFDLGGIDTRYYNASRNVLDARGFKPVRRIVYDHYDYDKLVREAARYQSTTK